MVDDREKLLPRRGGVAQKRSGGGVAHGGAPLRLCRDLRGRHERRSDHRRPRAASLLVFRHVMYAMVSGRRQTPDRHLEFFERRLVLEEETRERNASHEKKCLSAEERRLGMREIELQLRLREFEAAQEEGRQERAALLQQN
ncbi:hypothetical protein MRX96_000893 [Rhipicephalus microplus]